MGAKFIKIVLWLVYVSGLAIAPAHAKDSCVQVRLPSAQEPFCLEVADTFASCEAGLKNRNSLPNRGGVFFVISGNEPRVFWMKNTLIELDAIFLNGAGEVQSFVTRVSPGTIRLYAPARYVNELQGGTSEELGLWPGDKVLLPKTITELNILSETGYKNSFLGDFKRI